MEASLLDRIRTEIAALEPSDERSAEIWIAGPSALLIAKIHKINERLDSPNRLSDKDALDVFRLLQCVTTNSLTDRLNELRSSELAGDATSRALDVLPALFGSLGSPGTRMAVRAAGEQSLDATIAASLVALVQELLDDLAL